MGNFEITLLVLAALGVLFAFLAWLTARAALVSAKKREISKDEIYALAESIRRDMDRKEEDTVNLIQASFHNFGSLIGQGQENQARRQDERLDDMNKRIATFTDQSRLGLDGIRNTVAERLSDMNRDNNIHLEMMRKTVDEKLEKTLNERIGQSFRLVNERLEEVYKGLGEMQSLASDVGDLKKVLSNVKTRGILGEVQLEAILEEILTPDQYAKNIVTKHYGKDRVEFAVKLPGPGDEPCYLPIDAKFPGDTYVKLQDAYESGDKAEIDRAGKALEQFIKGEAKNIRDKYLDPPYTTDFGIMFLPFEGLYAEVVRRGLIEVLQRDYNVNIAGPTTMAAFLSSLKMGFRTLAIQKHSSRVWEVLGAVRTEFDKFEEVLVKAQERLRLADKDLDTLIGTRTNTIKRKLRDVERVDKEEASKILND
jgi:DNA recombination protein RmuC